MEVADEEGLGRRVYGHRVPAVGTTAGRLTWQATARNKVTAYMVNGNQCYCNFLMGTTPAIIPARLAKVGFQVDF